MDDYPKMIDLHGHKMFLEGPTIVEILCRKSTVSEACEYAARTIPTFSFKVERVEIEPHSEGFLIRFECDPLTYFTSDNCEICRETLASI